MSLIIKIIQIVVCVATIVACYSLSYIQTLSNNQQATQFLDSGRGYEIVSLLVRQQINDNLSKSLVSNTEVKSALDKSATPEQIKKVLQSTQINLIDWLHSSKDIQKLELNLNLQTLKSKILENITDPNVSFELRKDIPDTLVLTSSEQSSASLYSMASQLRISLQLANQLFFWSMVVLSVGVALLIILSMTKGSKLITSSAWPILIASVIMLVMVAVFQLLDYIKISPQLDLKNLNFTVVYFASRAVVLQNTMPSMILTVFSSGVILVSKIAFRSKDKRLKEKHR